MKTLFLCLLLCGVACAQVDGTDDTKPGFNPCLVSQLRFGPLGTYPPGACPLPDGTCCWTSGRRWAATQPTVTSAPNFTLSNDSTKKTVNPGPTDPLFSVSQSDDTIQITITQTPLNGYTGTTNLIAMGPLNPDLVLSPTSITGAGTATLTIYTKGKPLHDYGFCVLENSAQTSHETCGSYRITAPTSATVAVFVSPVFDIVSTPSSLGQVDPAALVPEACCSTGNNLPLSPIETRGTATAQFIVTASLLAGYAPGRVLIYAAGTLDDGISVSYGSTITLNGPHPATVANFQAISPLPTQAQQYLAGTITCDSYTAGSGPDDLTCDQVLALGTFSSASRAVTVSSSSSAALGTHAIQFAANVGGSTFAAQRPAVVNVVP